MEDARRNFPDRGVRGTNNMEASRSCPRARTRWRFWPYVRLFLINLLAAVITTAIAVLVLSLVYSEHFNSYKNDGSNTGTPPANESFLFLFHLGQSKCRGKKG